jgi:ketosteroid isomerase-like protein
MAHPNEDLARRGYEAFAKGDLDTLNSLMADELVWHVPGRGPLAGEYKGKEAVFGLFGKVVELAGGTFHQEIHDVLANDEHALVMVESHAERGDKRLNDRQVHVLHLKDGKLTEFWNHFGDQYAVDEFWS